MVEVKVKEIQKQILQRKNIIIHGDLDGILSYALLKNINPDIQLIGIYDLKDLLLFNQSKINVQNTLFLDLDMTYDNFFSIGHHMQLFYNHSTCNINPNSLWQIQNFSQKYPFNTFIFLLFLFDIPLSVFDFETICLFYNTDSVIYNCKKYSKNVQFWDSLLNTNIYEQFKKRESQILEGIERFKKKLGVNKQGFPQFKIDLKQRDKYEKLFQYIREKFNVDLSILTDKNVPLYFFNKTYRLEYTVSHRSMLEQIINEFQKEGKKILSHSWTYQSTVNITYLCISKNT